MNTDDIKIEIESFLKKENITVASSKLVSYIELLNKWNKAYNLTAIRNVDDMLPMHIFDSLKVLPKIKGKRIIDVGTGPGLPGIPLAIAMPDSRFTLLDSNSKKTRFLHEVVRVLELANVEVVKERVEDYHIDTRFDTVVSRAFSSISQMVRLTSHLLSSGYWVLMKGPNYQKELDDITFAYDISSYSIAKTERQRYVIVIKKEQL